MLLLISKMLKKLLLNVLLLEIALMKPSNYHFLQAYQNSLTLTLIQTQMKVLVVMKVVTRRMLITIKDQQHIASHNSTHIQLKVYIQKHQNKNLKKCNRTGKIATPFVKDTRMKQKNLMHNNGGRGLELVLVPVVVCVASEL